MLDNLMKYLKTDILAICKQITNIVTASNEL